MPLLIYIIIESLLSKDGLHPTSFGLKGVCLFIDHIKVENLSPENLSPENMFQSIDPRDNDTDGHININNPDEHRRHLSASQSSPTSGYNTMGSSPGLSSNSPYSQSSGSPQNNHGYPNSCCSPTDNNSVASPPCHVTNGNTGSGYPLSPPTRANLPLSPTHYAAIHNQAQVHAIKQQQQQRQRGQHHPMFVCLFISWFIDTLSSKELYSVVTSFNI